MLKINKINKSYDSRVLKDIDLEINEGELVAILGENGSGKTTLMKIICDIVIADSGYILYENKPFIKKNLRDITMLLEGNRNFYNELTILENIKYLYRIKGFQFDNHSYNRLEYISDLFNLTPYLNTQLYKLSRGTLQKISLLLNFILPSKVIVLDEPTLGLDANTREKFIELIKNEISFNNKIILITTHHLEILEKLNCRLVVLDDGEIKYDGTSVKFLDEFSSQLIEIEYKNNDFIKNKSFKNGLEKYKYKIDGNKIVIYLNNQDSIDIRYFTNNVEVISYKKIQSNLEETYRKFRDNLTNREI